MGLLQIKRRAGKTSVVFGTVVDISQARALYDGMNKLLSRNSPLLMDVSGIERIDTAAIQLLVMFHRTALDRGVEIQWKSSSEAVLLAVALLGLQSQTGWVR
jgi:anti-anti-sigma regulatory factor